MSDPADEGISFTLASTSALKEPHMLHPRACNPAMDLAVLLAESDEKSVSTLVSLWRLSGTSVWEVVVSGRVLGLTWSTDGKFVSLLVLRVNSWPPNGDVTAATEKSTVEHLSVHTGEVVKSVSVPPFLREKIPEDDMKPSAERPPHFTWWPMAWVAAEGSWPEQKPGAPLMIIDSLPAVTPVDPPKPAIFNPFAPPPKASNTKGLHEKLKSAPSLLSSTPRTPPSVLTITVPSRDVTARLLTGTYLLPAGVPDALATLPVPLLEVSMRADSITHLLDTVMRGLESCAAAFKDANKQTFLWCDELEICGQQQAMSARDVHADLFRFLVTGRPSPPITEWLGNKLTNRPVAKWDQTVQTGFITIQKVLAQSVIPALERILLIFEEMNGWAHDLLKFEVVLDAEGIQNAMRLARGLATLCEEMRASAALEWETAVEWFRWLRYEMSRAISSEEVPAPTHDVKLVWSFLVNGFRSSRFKKHFPNVPDQADAILPDLPSPVDVPQQSLNDIMAGTLAALRGAHDADRSTALDIEPPSPTPNRSNGSNGHAASGDSNGGGSGDEERDLPVEPWAWANALLAATDQLVVSARMRHPVSTRPGQPLHALGVPLLDETKLDGVHWALHLASPDSLYILCHDPADTHVLRLVRLASDAQIVQAAFYDDQLVLVLHASGRRRLAMTGLGVEMSAVSLGPGFSLSLVEQSLKPIQLTPTRTRILGSRRAGVPESWQLALNPNEGRRSGWVLGKDRDELLVFDLDVDEDEDDNDEEDQDESDEYDDDMFDED